MTSRRSWPVHHLLLAPIPALALYVANPGLTPREELIGASSFLLLIVLGLWGLLRVLSMPPGRAELTTTTVFAWMFVFTPVVVGTRDLSNLPSTAAVGLGVGVWGALMLVAVVVISRATAEKVYRVNAALERGAGILLLILVVLLAPQLARGAPPLAPIAVPPADPPPASLDVYHIVLDGYGGSDVLREIYGIEKSPLLRFLDERGFEIVDPARSNYGQTLLSIAATLNAVYLDTLVRADPSGEPDRAPLLDLIQNNRVMEFFEARGYETVTLASGYSSTELRGSDEYVRPNFDLSEYQGLLFGLTPLPVVNALVPGGWSPAIADAHERHRRRIRRAFTAMEEVSSRPHATYTFAHILAPHPPFVFDSGGAARRPSIPYSLEDGSHLLTHLSAREYVEGYRGQILYISTLLVETLEVILETSSSPPIIIIQGDHGPGLGLDHNSVTRTDARERLSILSALYLPGSRTPPPPGMTPVNTYRLILDEYFGTDLGLLPDRSYLSTWRRPYDFREVPAEETPPRPLEASTAASNAPQPSRR